MPIKQVSNPNCLTHWPGCLQDDSPLLESIAQERLSILASSHVPLILLIFTLVSPLCLYQAERKMDGPAQLAI